LKTKKIIIFFLLLIPLIVMAIYANMPVKQPEMELVSKDINPDSIDITNPAYETSNSMDTTNLFPFPTEGIPVLMYHSISTAPGNTLCVSETQFQEEMAWLENNNYHTLNMDQLYDALVNGASVPENPIVITFDDGYADNYQVAWPILKQYGFTATFFVITNYVGTDTIDWNQLKELISQGNSIGSHSVHHLDMITLSNAQQESELSQSKQILEASLGTSIIAFCFPSGQYYDTTLKILSDTGYKLSFTTRPGKVYLGNNQFKLHRVRIDGGMSLSGFISQVSY